MRVKVVCEWAAVANTRACAVAGLRSPRSEVNVGRKGIEGGGVRDQVI